MCSLSDLLRNFNYVHINFYDISDRFFQFCLLSPFLKMLFHCLMGFLFFFFHFPSNNITEKWCEIDKSVSFLFHSQTHTHMNQRTCMKYRRCKENLENHVHAIFTSVVNENLKTWRTRVLQDLQAARCCQEHAVICGSSHFLDHKRAWRQESTTEALKNCIRLLNNWIHETLLCGVSQLCSP